MQSPDQRIEVSVAEQVLRLFGGDNRLFAEYPVSTSKFGLGAQPGSYRTPLGRFQVSDKIGGDQPVYTIFKGRQPVGVWDPARPAAHLAADEGGDDDIPGNDEDLVLTRILWLDGLDPGNANTRDRFIYIHGTNQEHLIGTPASHGCVRMRNTDITDLFTRVPPNTRVTIT